MSELTFGKNSENLGLEGQVTPVELDIATDIAGQPIPSALYHESLRSEFEPAIRTGKSSTQSRPSLSYWQDAWLRLKKNNQSIASLVIVALLLLFTVAGPWIWRVSPSDQNMNRISERPSFSRVAVVQGELGSFEEITAPGVPAVPTGNVSGADLPAPTSLEILGVPSRDAVRLKWAPVSGAAGYELYRNEKKPQGGSDLGVPLAEVEGGNRISYEDRFNLESKSYYYSVVAKNGEESPHAATLEVKVPITIGLSDAQLIKPDAKPGDQVELHAHPMGTDYLGRDLLARMMAGARVSLFIGFFAPLLSILIGVALGGISGYFGGRMDNWIMRITDFVLALPFLLFMILFKVAFGAEAGESGVMPMLVAMVLLSWTGPARLTRGQILQLRESEFVQASRLLGARSMYLIFRHLLPNTMGVILVSLTFAIPSAIFTEAFLSFIGMGVVPPTPSWGSMCNDGIQTFLTHPHEFLFPALFISLAVLAFNLLGDGLRDALDPRMRSNG